MKAKVGMPIKKRLHKEQLHNVLIGPIVTEKSTLAGDKENSVAFWVNPKANKYEIRAAVELFFSVKVDSVSTSRLPRDKKRFGNIEGTAKQRKKAYVQLQQGQEIDFADF